jgi:hypothetical protein
MRKLMAVVLFALLTVSPGAVFAACPPGGQCPFTGCSWFNWLSNSSFYSGSSCWTLSGSIAFKTDGVMCGNVPNYVQFNQTLGGSTLTQTIHIPGPGETGYVGGVDPSRFEFQYQLQINDPNHSAWDVLTINLYDAHTGATLQNIATWHGSDTNPNCGLTYLDFHNSGMLGKDVRVDIVASVPLTGANFKINNIYLWQYDSPF